MGGLADRIRYVLAHPLSDDHAIDPMRELANVLRGVGLEPESGGGAVTFAGRDPIVGSPLHLATMAAVALMAKAVSVAELWRFRGGQGQDLSVNLGKALHRLCPFYDKKWELLNGYAPGNPADPKNPFMPTKTMYRTRDNRRILFMNIYPGIRTAALAFLGCNDDPTAIGNVIRKWDALDLEEHANRAGLQATACAVDRSSSTPSSAAISKICRSWNRKDRGQRPQDRMVKELRLAGVSSMAAANAWLPGFVTAYNTRFGRDPANAKNLHRPLAQTDDLDEILAWREERTVTRNLTLHYDRMMLLLDPTSLARGLVRKKVEVVNYPDGRFAVQFRESSAAGGSRERRS